MFSKLFLAIATVAVAVNAQGTSDIPPCVLACAVPAATINNCTYTDASCICASAQFVADVTACLTAHCTADDITAALALQTSQCSAAGITPTGTATAPNSIPFTLASTSTDASASGSASGSASVSAGSTTSAPATSTHTTPAGSTSRASSAPASSTGAPATTSSAAASGLIAQSGAGAFIGAVLAGVLAL